MTKLRAHDLRRSQDRRRGSTTRITAEDADGFGVPCPAREILRARSLPISRLRVGDAGGVVPARSAEQRAFIVPDPGKLPRTGLLPAAGGHIR